MEAPETAAHMAETSDMGDTHAVGETATPKMGDIYAGSAKPSLPKWAALMLRPKPMP